MVDLLWLTCFYLLISRCFKKDLFGNQLLLFMASTLATLHSNSVLSAAEAFKATFPY